MTVRIVVLSGEGLHADPWHAFDATSAAIAGVLSAVGEVEVIGTDAATAAPAAATIIDAELLVVNASADLALEPGDSSALVDLLVARHACGRAILAMHAATLAFGDDPRWAGVVGGRWVPGTSGHPQIGHALVQSVARETGSGASGGAAPPSTGDFVLYDERYTALECADANDVLAVHTEDGIVHPLVWWRPPADGSGAVAYDALGHGVESFESAAHADWLRRAAAALVSAAVDARSGAAPTREVA
ncbi:hypothetical protein ACDF64_09670 [Agromyces sp. MMS24-JH15]|uniref:hypothetical protein n=1 Tax=Agromyces sp. MMS24-JH15 TaxID=3243765 RepID=UPI00374A91E4